MDSEDIPQVSDLYRKMYHEQEQLGMITQFQSESVETMLTSWVQSKFYLCFVAETQDALQGFAIGSLSRFSGKYIYGSQPFFGFVHDVYVEEQWRRSGLGQQLTAALEESFRAEGIELVELHVLEDNVTGQAFWRRHGFEDAVRIMYKKL